MKNVLEQKMVIGDFYLIDNNISKSIIKISIIDKDFISGMVFDIDTNNINNKKSLSNRISDMSRRTYKKFDNFQKLESIPKEIENEFQFIENIWYYLNKINNKNEINPSMFDINYQLSDNNEKELITLFNEIPNFNIDLSLIKKYL